MALLQPAAGVWLIAVWSSQPSAFSIMAADNSTDSQPLELGVTYPGYVPRGQYVYYSVYLDALLLANPTAAATSTSS